KRVLFVGHIEHGELPKYLHISDVFVRPSLSEGLGISFIEAMAAGVPVVATEVGGITDFLKNGETGLFCGVHDPRGISEKTELLMGDNTLRENIIKNAQAMVKDTYDWNLITKDMKEKVFDKLNIRKNILIATGIFPPDIGGPATYSKLLLDKLPKHNLNVEVLSFGEVRRLPKIIRHIAYFFKVLDRGRRADIIYAQDPVSVGFPTALASYVLRKKFILKVVGDYAWEQMHVEGSDFITPEEFQTGKYDFKTEVRRGVERWVAWKADKVIVPSEYLKKIVSMWGIDENNIKVIFNGINLDKDYGNKETLRNLLQFEGDLIITAGRLVPWKGFDTLIKIFPEIKKRFKDAKLIIIGSGPQMNQLQNLIDEKGLEGDIALTGALAKDLVLRYKRAADMFVLNTAYEGLSHHILEAMDIGIPIVTTNVGGNTELIKDGENGLLTGFNDEKGLTESIIKLLDDREYANSLAIESKKKIQEFSKEKMVKNTVSMLKAI
ncbi:glycosyltransferase family 4 protein, partial [Candidatus Woesearchaeota archaeon]|nr:glycosyltransferase family 4 protein [Candidatus Woesearchaeota archaeon]